MVFTGFSGLWKNTGFFVQGDLRGRNFGSSVTSLIRYDNSGIISTYVVFLS